MRCSARENIAFFRLHGIKRSQQSHAEFNRVAAIIDAEKQITEKDLCKADLYEYMQLNKQLPAPPKQSIHTTHFQGMKSFDTTTWKKMMLLYLTTTTLV